MLLTVKLSTHKTVYCTYSAMCRNDTKSCSGSIATIVVQTKYTAVSSKRYAMPNALPKLLHSTLSLFHR